MMNETEIGRNPEEEQNINKNNIENKGVELKDSTEVNIYAKDGIDAIGRGDTEAAKRFLGECRGSISEHTDPKSLDAAEEFAILFMKEIDSDVGHELLETVREQKEKNEK